MCFENVRVCLSALYFTTNDFKIAIQLFKIKWVICHRQDVIYDIVPLKHRIGYALMRLASIKKHCFTVLRIIILCKSQDSAQAISSK